MPDLNDPYPIIIFMLVMAVLVVFQLNPHGVVNGDGVDDPLSESYRLMALFCHPDDVSA